MVDPKAIQQISFTGKVDWTENTIMFFIIEEEKKKLFWIFHKETARVLKIHFSLI